MTTETKMWNTLTRYRGDVKFNRIECSTLTGVSDIEYVGTYSHGWIEGKIGSFKDLDAPIKLQHPLSSAQAIWLIEHQRPEIHLRSYLLIGIDTTHHRRIKTLLRGYLLIPPRLATLFLNLEPPTASKLITLGAALCPDLESLVELIRKGGLR